MEILGDFFNCWFSKCACVSLCRNRYIIRYALNLFRAASTFSCCTKPRGYSQCSCKWSGCNDYRPFIWEFLWCIHLFYSQRTPSPNIFPPSSSFSLRTIRHTSLVSSGLVAWVVNRNWCITFDISDAVVCGAAIRLRGYRTFVC